ncbi:hypothetical protein OPT61_g339 [Boeremia exigua]|uniref:Uncharacterized protein n=1 Tax=Boeremia exigua TaxID=749465 RepID=A0ACC2IUJ6_9PLEO|nr:hypothetical protein OPT61_g339 [Boeremia exigua]
MLLVGHYARRSGGPSVWALATGTCVRYHHGETSRVVPLTQDIHTSKIYYDLPVKSMGGYKTSSDSRPNGMSPARRVERDIVEAMIHFLFLLTGRLERTFNLPNPDLLSNFKSACRNYRRETTRSRAASVALMEECEAIEAHNLSRQTVAQQSPDAWGQSESDRNEEDAVLVSQSLRNASNKRSRNASSHRSPRSTLYAHIDVYEANVRAQFEQQILDLEAQVKSQEAKLKSQEASCAMQKEKIEDLETRIAKEEGINKKAEREMEWRAQAESEAISNSELVSELSKKTNAAREWRKLAFDWRSRAVRAGVPCNGRSKRGREKKRNRENRAARKSLQEQDHNDAVIAKKEATNIDAFRGVLEHETLRNQVREIIWDDARLEDYEQRPLQSRKTPFEYYVTIVRDQTSNIQRQKENVRKAKLRRSGVRNMLSLRESYDLYNRLYIEQQVIIKSGEDTEALMLGLKSFPALKRVTVTPSAWRNGVYTYMMLLPWDEVYEEWRGYQIVVDAVLATSSAHKVEELIIDSNDELTGISHQLFASKENIGYASTVQLFQAIRLTTLELCLNPTEARMIDFNFLRNSLLRSALSHLSSLKRLTLSHGVDRSFTQNLVNIEEIIPLDTLAPTLQYLKLQHFHFRGESLYSGLIFLPALKTIVLDSIDLSDEFTWQAFFFRVKRELVQDTTSSPSWSPGMPELIVKNRIDKLNNRLDSSAEVQAFLFEDGDCPFAEETPQAAGVGWVVSIWDYVESYDTGPRGVGPPSAA